MSLRKDIIDVLKGNADDNEERLKEMEEHLSSIEKGVIESKIEEYEDKIDHLKTIKKESMKLKRKKERLKERLKVIKQEIRESNGKRTNTIMNKLRRLGEQIDDMINELYSLDIDKYIDVLETEEDDDDDEDGDDSEGYEDFRMPPGQFNPYSGLGNPYQQQQQYYPQQYYPPQQFYPPY